MTEKIKVSWTIEPSNPFHDTEHVPVTDIEYTGPLCRCGHSTPNPDVSEEIAHANTVRNNEWVSISDEFTNEISRAIDAEIMNEIMRMLK
jgi:CDGSH-type Zn-finger protein